MADLKPCPFCGGEAHISASSDGYGVECWNRRCIDMQMDELPTEAEAIAAWNTRAEMSYEDARILLDELGLSERMCHPVIAITDDGGYEYALCSECDGRIEPEDNYCPNCGARRVGE